MDPMIGMIFMVPYEWAPVDYLKCQGQVLPILQYNAMFSLIANLYGGDINNNTFALPNLSGRTAIGTGRSTTSSTVYSLTEAYGAEATTLTTANLPPHTHNATFKATTAPQKVTIPATTGTLKVQVNASKVNATGVAPANTLMLAQGTLGQSKYYGAVPSAASDITVLADQAASVTGTASTAATDVDITTVTGGTVTNDLAGAGVAFTNLQPSLALTFLIAVNGIYPRRP